MSEEYVDRDEFFRAVECSEHHDACDCREFVHAQRRSRLVSENEHLRVALTRWREAAEDRAAELDRLRVFGKSTCATCKWWTDITSQYDEKTLDHPRLEGDVYSRGELMPGRWGECTKVDELGPSSVNTQFYVTDGSDYRATLHTRETFDCSEWEQGS